MMTLSQSLVSSMVTLTFNHPLLIFISISLLFLAVRSIYRISVLHPLNHIPGPFYARLTSIWLNYQAYIGNECTAVHTLHRKYGPIVRISPDSVDISDGSVLHSIYVEKGGFLKPAFYGNFDIDGHKSIFSEIDPKLRAERAKAVASIFSTSSLRNGSETIGEAVDAFIARMKRETKDAGPNGKIDILAICRGLAIDVVTGYLFGERYGGCDEDIANSSLDLDTKPQEENGMTASAMVDSFVAVGKFWYLPPRTFQFADRAINFIWPNPKVDESINLVDTFVNNVVDKVINSKSSNSYPARLLTAGFTISETRAQCKDLIFAGTDSTAMNLATICFYLVKHPTIYQTLQKEIQDSNLNSDNDVDPQSLPYLRGIIKEGLRLSMANPSRLPRVVPQTGFTYNKTTIIPPGTIISCTPYELHFNPDIFPSPHTFNPDRWLDNNITEEMTRDHIPFGLGSRQCIARNLATLELFVAVKRIVEEDLLGGGGGGSGDSGGMRCYKDKIEILEWFNSHVVGGRIELVVGSGK